MDLTETLAEFEAEAKITRRFLEQLPADQLNWRPHAKSMSAGQLGLHIATVPTGICKLAQLTTTPAPDFSKPPPQPATIDEVLAAHDASVAYVREHLPALAGHLHETWSATVNNQVVFALPKSALIRSILLNHWIHHRGQFGVYLRLLGAKVPSSYGPSADESPFG